MTMGTLTMVAEATRGELRGADQSFESVNTDTRTLAAGQLFVALRGERFDAARFVGDAARLKAAGAVVDQWQPASIPQVRVGNTRTALGDLARAWRRQFQLPLIGITGSNGKTTAKEMIGAVLRQQFPGDGESAVLVTRGNLNNDIGVPLTLLWLRATHRAAVIEMGANHKREIDYLAGIAEPTVGLVLNAGPAHLEGFGGTLRDVAEGKGEMFARIGGSATAIINRDDTFYDYWRSVATPRPIRTFGLHPDADFRAIDVAARGSALDFTLVTPAGSTAVSLPMSGRHNVMNALAAAAATTAAGASLDAIRRGLAAVGNVAGRLQPVVTRFGRSLYDDSYNANPGSVAAAVDFLAAQSGRRFLVLGDMAELGTDAARLHRDIGALARERGIDRLYVVGELSRATAEGFGPKARWFADVPALIEALAAEQEGADAILVKGSRFMGLERVVHALTGGVPAGGGSH